MPMSFAICHLSFVICHLSLNTRNYLLPPQLRANPNPARSATATKISHSPKDCTTIYGQWAFAAGWMKSKCCPAMTYTSRWTGAFACGTRCCSAPPDTRCTGAGAKIRRAHLRRLHGQSVAFAELARPGRRTRSRNTDRRDRRRGSQTEAYALQKRFAAWRRVRRNFAERDGVAGV